MSRVVGLRSGLIMVEILSFSLFSLLLKRFKLKQPGFKRTSRAKPRGGGEEAVSGSRQENTHANERTVTSEIK